MNSYNVDRQWLQQICRENQAKNGEIAAMQSRLRDSIGRLNGQVELARRLEAEVHYEIDSVISIFDHQFPWEK